MALRNSALGSDLDLTGPDALNIIVGERYKLTRPIGSGSFGEVFEGVDLISGNRVAVKLEEVSQPESKRMLFYEATISRALQSSDQSYVPKLYHLGQEGDYNILVQ